MTPGWLKALIVAIPVALIVTRATKRRSLGASSVDPWANTGDPEIDPDDYSAEARRFYTAKPAKDKGDCLRLGKDHNRYTFGQYTVCLTENQKQTLFKGKLGKKLGCGVFACAYAIPKNTTKVIKFTRDSEDVAALLQAQPTGVVPKVSRVFKLNSEGFNEHEEATTVYAIELERLKPFTPADRERLDEELPYLNDVGRYGAPDTAKEFCADRECSPIAEQTVDAILKLRAAGIEWSDVHSGNIGLDKNGKVKVLDLGVSGTKLVEEPQLLADGARKLRRKRILRPV